MAKKRKLQQSTKTNQETVVRPGCKKNKLDVTSNLDLDQDQDVCLDVQQHQDVQDVHLVQDIRLDAEDHVMKYPSIETFIGPLVTIEKCPEDETKKVLVIDFNRHPYFDPRFQFLDVLWFLFIAMLNIWQLHCRLQQMF